jgi:hypothetical protein
MGQKRSRPPKGAAKGLRRRADQGPTVVVSVSRLLAAFESGVEEETVAVFERTAAGAAVTVTTMDIVADPAEPIAPRLAVTRPFVPTVGPLQVPWLGMQERNVVPVGSGSFRATALAVAGPLLFTVSV